MDGKYQIISILSSLISNLIKNGYNDPVDEILEILEEQANREHGNPETTIPANIVGLRGDTKPEDMSQGFTLEPFFSNYGPVGQ